jgi:hypothetical protein
MYKKPNSGVQLNCFSPPVMLLTFSVEIVLALYTVWRYKLNPVGRLVLAILLALAAFQLCEYYVCGGLGVAAEQWSRAGFAAITLLPPLGLHLLYVLAGWRGRRLVGVAYTTMVGFVAYFLLAPSAFSGHVCAGNYVIFQIGTYSAWFYTLYYYGWMLVALYGAVRWASTQPKSKKTRPRVQSVWALVAGYLVFLVPTAIANTVKPETISGVPSVMCGFAVFLAFILVLYMLPRMGVRRSSSE